ncbi:MAG: hypothetical protein U1F77_12820 [Kiritimatiellia bacterium]
MQRQMEAVAGQVKAPWKRDSRASPPHRPPSRPLRLGNSRRSAVRSKSPWRRPPGAGGETEAQGEVFKESIAALATNRTNAAAQPAPADASGAGQRGGSHGHRLGRGGKLVHRPSSVISGGFTNVAEEAFAVIGGGAQNRSAGKYATIAGGSANLAQGTYSAVGGGRENQGLGAYVSLPGAATTWPRPTTPRRRAAREGVAQGGVRLGRLHRRGFRSAARRPSSLLFVRPPAASRWPPPPPLNSGVELPAGASAWSVRYETRLKPSISPTSIRSTPRPRRAMPIRAFSLKSQRDDIRHIGPVAEDFHAHFPYGEDDRLINTADLDGIALSAIQG